MTRNGENDGTVRPGHVQHSLGDRLVETFELSFALVEIVAVGHSRVGLQIGKTRVNPSPQDDPIGPIQCLLDADGPQFRVARPKTCDDDVRSCHAFVAALSPPRLNTARNAS